MPWRERWWQHCSHWRGPRVRPPCFTSWTTSSHFLCVPSFLIWEWVEILVPLHRAAVRSESTGDRAHLPLLCFRTSCGYEETRSIEALHGLCSLPPCRCLSSLLRWQVTAYTLHPVPHSLPLEPRESVLFHSMVGSRWPHACAHSVCSTQTSLSMTLCISQVSPLSEDILDSFHPGRTQHFLSCALITLCQPLTSWRLCDPRLHMPAVPLTIIVMADVHRAHLCARHCYKDYLN